VASRPPEPAPAEHRDHLRHLRDVEHLAPAFGGDTFGHRAEAFARFFGTPRFIILQSTVVVAWIASNAVALFHFDPYPFILLNLAFSTQAAYAAPLILLAQTRQADRDKGLAEADARHREELAEISSKQDEQLRLMLDQNTRLTEQIDRLTGEIHRRVVPAG
jgi:uncharacterized membrane protein